MASYRASSSTSLASLLEKIERGDDVVIERHGKPIARMLPHGVTIVRHQRDAGFGAWKGQGWIADDFDETSEDAVRLFEESKLFPA